MIPIPGEVVDWLKGVFRRCNEQASLKLTRIPNTHEEWLDYSVIENLTQVAVPVRFSGDWTVEINTHFLGSSPLYGRWEIADIGIIVVFSTAGRLVRSKVALLQCKRLYPDEQEPESFPEFERRYIRGFGGLFPSESELTQLVQERHFTFTAASRYKALVPNDPQYKAIEKYETSHSIPVYYLLYNPWMLPHSIRVPISDLTISGDCKVGCRVIPAKHLRKVISSKKRRLAPSYSELASKLESPFRSSPHRSGWRLEHFVVDLLLQCKTGRITDVRDDPGLYRVFNLRSGPIAAALSITIDAPSGFDWTIEDA